MSGREFEQPSFTVPMSTGKASPKCTRCNNDIKEDDNETTYKISGQRVCKECFNK